MFVIAGHSVKGDTVPEGKKTLKGMEIFATGYHIPAEGPARNWTEADLKEVVRAWDDGQASPVYMKIGHTSDAFCALVAAKLGVPIEIVKGEGPGGGGMISLGTITDLKYSDQRLIADFEVPDAVEALLSKGYTNVSAEILMSPNADYPLILSAVAVLGAERPAVEDLAGLEEVAVISSRKPQLVMSFAVLGGRLQIPDPMKELERMEELTHSMTEVIKGNKARAALKAVWERLRGKWDELLATEPPTGGTPYQETEGTDVDIKTLAEKLQLQDGAEEGAVLSAIDQLMGLVSMIAEAMGLGGGAVPEEQVLKEKLTDLLAQAKLAEKGEFSQNQVVIQLQGSVASLLKDKRLLAFAEVVRPFTAVEGKVEDLAAELMELEDKVGAPAMERQIAHWKGAQSLAKSAGLLTSLGTSRTGDEVVHPVLVEMEAWAKENSEGDINAAYAHFREHQPTKWREFRAATTGVA